MGEFYKTASANPLDYMHRINTPLMEQVIAANDAYITNNLSELDQLNTASGSFGYLKPDEDRARQITQEYYGKINDIANTIKADPANWKRQVSTIKGLSNDLAANYKTGEISKIASNYSTYKTVADSIDKQVEEFNKSGKGVSADRAKAYKQYYLNQFLAKNPRGTAYNSGTGEYNQLIADAPMANIDIRAKLAEGLDKLKDDGEIRISDDLTKGGEYFNKTTNKWEGVTPERILSIVSDKLNDPQLLNYLKSDSTVGLIKGIYDPSGKFMSPYSYINPAISSFEDKNIQSLKNQIAKAKDGKTKSVLQSQLDNYTDGLKNKRELKWNDDSYLSPVLRGIVKEYAHGKSDIENDLSNNSLYNTKYTQAMENSRDALNRASREKTHGEDLAWKKDEFKQTEDNLDRRLKEKLEATQKLQDSKPAKTGTGTAAPKKAAPTAPSETGVSKIATNSFQNITTTDRTTGTQVPLLSLAGVTSSMSDLKDQKEGITSTLDGVNKALADPNINPVLKASLVVQKQTLETKQKDVESDLGLRRTWYKAATDAALSNNQSTGVTLTPSEIELYHKFDSDRDGEKMKELIRTSQVDANQYAKSRVDDSKKINRFSINKDTPSKHTGTTEFYLDGYGNTLDRPSYHTTPELDKMRKDLSTYQDIVKKVNKAKNNFLDKVRHDNITDDAIVPNDADSKIVSDMILATPQGLKIFDANGENPSGATLEGKGISWGDSKADNYNFDFVGSMGLDKYIKEHHVNVKVSKVANTTGIGSGGAVAEVYFDDPNGQIPGNKPYYIELNGEAQKAIGTKFKTNKNPEIVSIATKLTDEQGNAIRKQFIKPHLNNVSGEAQGEEPGSFNVFVQSSDGKKIPLNVIRYNDNGVVKLNVTMQKADGSVVPFFFDDGKTPPPNGVAGLFNGVEDFLEYYNKVPK